MPGRNLTYCPVNLDDQHSSFEIKCALDEDCTCASVSLVRELVNVTIDGLSCYACEPRRPPACTEAQDQCTPEFCECANAWTHVKQSATTVDGSTCYYCEPVDGYSRFGRSELLTAAAAVFLVVLIWQVVGRKQVSVGRGSLRLSRRQGDRSRAIRVHQEPLRFHEEVLLTLGDAFDTLVDWACELLGGVWSLLQGAITCIGSLGGLLLELVDWALGSSCSLAQAASQRASSIAASVASCSCRSRHRKPAAPAPSPSKQQQQQSAASKQPTAAGSGSSAVGAGAGGNAQARKHAAKMQSQADASSSAASAPTAKAAATARRGASAATPTVVASSAASSSSLGAAAAGGGRQRKATAATTTAQGGGLRRRHSQPQPEAQQPQQQQPQQPKAAAVASRPQQQEEEEPQQLRQQQQQQPSERQHEQAAAAPSTEADKAKVAGEALLAPAPIEKAAVAADLDEGSTDGDVGVANPVGNEDAETASSGDREDCDLAQEAPRPNTAAAAAAILAAAVDKRAAALQLLEACKMQTVEVRTFLAEPEVEVPPLRRTQSDSDVMLYA
eukprot:TRINITY_DN5605_c0_g1_i1.p1 TRINITY_DN5605_c0_g1~~TRINITY_DN5605_c0_g1_i1.p1  ORF type:complete len:558 (-),score=135.34 TRINITY_DN5605_c0_g1_i1:68-1741(-)